MISEYKDENRMHLLFYYSFCDPMEEHNKKKVIRIEQKTNYNVDYLTSINYELSFCLRFSLCSSVSEFELSLPKESSSASLILLSPTLLFIFASKQIFHN